MGTPPGECVSFLDDTSLYHHVVGQGLGLAWTCGLCMPVHGCSLIRSVVFSHLQPSFLCAVCAIGACGVCCLVGSDVHWRTHRQQQLGTCSLLWAAASVAFARYARLNRPGSGRRSAESEGARSLERRVVIPSCLRLCLACRAQDRASWKRDVATEKLERSCLG